MDEQNNILAIMKSHNLVPVVTFNDGDDPFDFVDYLQSKGVNCIEITLRTNAGFKAIKLLKAKRPDVLVGAGTVIAAGQIQKLKDIGVDFLVSPGLTAELLQSLKSSGIPFLPGVATPSEIMAAKEKGLTALKFFPANLFGGIKSLKAYGQVFPDIKFCPTGGITSESSRDYLFLDNVFAIGGSWFQNKFKES